jgi:hypothetical protein
LAGREAFIELAEFVGDRHLEMISPPGAQHCRFQERPGPGPQLADFGEFATVLVATPFEARF